MSNLPVEVDAIVCGGGPGGSTAATVLAQAGRSVVLFERERFPRFHIGESLLPFNLPLLERIGALAKVKAAGAQVKMGARFYHQGTEATRFVKFANGVDRGYESAFQVKRAEFDDLLLRHSEENGVKVFEETRVEEVLFEGERATGVRVKLAGETELRTVKAKVVIDATGRDALLSKKYGSRERDPNLERVAVFTHVDAFDRAPGAEGGDIVIITTRDGWWWFIPFSDGTASVGLVMPTARFAKKTGNAEQFFDAAIAQTPEVRHLLRDSKMTMKPQVIADYSYSAARFAGDGWVLVGDAAGFLDPVFSTGVLLAMRSGELAAEAAAHAIAKRGVVVEADFLPVTKKYEAAVERFRRFVYGFYKPHVLETFYTKSPNRLIEAGVTTVLAGGVFEPTWKARFWAGLFHLATHSFRLRQAFRGAGAFEGAAGLVQATRTT